MSGAHARVFWFGPQLVLGSLLGQEGDEAASLDVFRSVEMSLDGNHLAAGEWNKSIDAAGRVSILERAGQGHAALSALSAI